MSEEGRKGKEKKGGMHGKREKERSKDGIYECTKEENNQRMY